MATPTIAETLKYANLQMAAEALHNNRGQTTFNFALTALISEPITCPAAHALHYRMSRCT